MKPLRYGDLELLFHRVHHAFFLLGSYGSCRSLVRLQIEDGFLDTQNYMCLEKCLFVSTMAMASKKYQCPQNVPVSYEMWSQFCGPFDGTLVLKILANGNLNAIFLVVELLVGVPDKSNGN